MRIRQQKSAKEVVTPKACNQLQRFDKDSLNKNRRNFEESTTAASTSGPGKGLYAILKGLTVYLKCNLIILVTKRPFNKRQRILIMLRIILTLPVRRAVGMTSKGFYKHNSA